MIDWTWIAVSDTAALMVFLTAIVIYATLILFSRISGLRSFSKLSGFDFAVTVGIGTVLAGTLLNKEPPMLQGIAALAVLYLMQHVVGVARVRSGWVRSLVNNEPLLIMAGDRILEDNLRRARMTRGDLRAKLREANVVDPRQVHAVVMETTGDVSVVHAALDSDVELDLDLLDGVRGVDLLRGKDTVD